MHTHFVALQKKAANTQEATKSSKIRRPLKNCILLLDQWVREILAFERLANIFQEKKVGIAQAIFFAVLIKMQIFANVCVSTQPPSGPIMVPGDGQRATANGPEPRRSDSGHRPGSPLRGILAPGKGALDGRAAAGDSSL
jgi:hypothetical protein